MAESKSTAVDLPAIDNDSRDMLEGEVKKGKPRKFILVCKGSQVRSLVVFKKGPYGPRINATRKSGFRGEFYCGVITGKGVNVDLQLPGNSAVSDAMKAEGNVYDDVPCKVAKLRAFFVEEAGLKFKPEITIVRSVDDVAVVDESDTPGIAEGGAVAASANGNAAAADPAVATVPQPPPTDGRRADYLNRQQWDAVLAKVGRASDETTKKSLLNQVVGALKNERTKLQNDPFLAADSKAKQAQVDLHVAVAQELQALAARGLPQSAAAQAAPQAPSAGSGKAAYRTQPEWDALLANVASARDDKTKKALLNAAVTELKDERTRAEADRFLASDANAKAKQIGIHVAVARELKTLSATAATPTAPQAPPQAPSQTPPEAPPEASQKERGADARTDEFRKRWAAARGNLRAALDRVEGQLVSLAEALLKSDDPNMIWVAEEGLTQLLGGLRGSATTIDKSSSKVPARIAAFARPALGELEKQLNSPQVRVCDENKFGVKVSIRRTIEAAIEEMRQVLESAPAN